MLHVSAYRRAIAFALAGIFAIGIAASASAETEWQRTHTRRTEVNGRLNNQNRRIHKEVKEGEISHRQAAALHHEDHQIRHEERRMASRDSGHITRADQRRLNHQENEVSHQIGQ